MALPASGDTLTNAYVYQLITNVSLGTLVGVTATDLITSVSGSPVTFGTDATTNALTISYTEQDGTVVTQDISTTSNAESTSAFTYTSNGITYVVSNTALQGNLLDVTVGNLIALANGLSDVGLISGETDYVACFMQGTAILTPEGQVQVQDLAVGDEVLSVSGQRTPIRWIGTRSYAGRFFAGNPKLHPIRFLAGSLGDGLPHRDLLVSPEHAMLLNGVLVPATLLVNGTTIVQERGLKRVDYFHVELDSHDVLLAEGAPSESFVDDDSRGMFHNAAEWERMYPGRERVPAVFCAPRVESGPELEAIRRRLNTLAGQFAQAA